ncbi:hypothetical protein [Agrobacterium tumefaciens]|uniref:hypothetical protein n=1 Tax=Agrobacterium tumefaciens TaxID=358 RepID=UPI0021CF8A82|nr:hypothetical protein [Agrobacterium tumefaciens]
MVDRIIPRYVSEQTNAPIELGCRNAEIFSNGKTINGRGWAQLHLGLREHVVVTVEVEDYFDAASILYSSADLMLKLEGASHPTAVISTQTRTTDEKCELKLVARSGTFELCRDRRIRLKSAILHLVSFPAFVCLCENSPDFLFEEGGKHQRLGRIVLAHKEWLIEIQELPRTREIVKQLKSDGGSGITHVVKVDRCDGKSFPISALWRVIGDLHRFLSFARGQWTSIFGPAGYDAGNASVYDHGEHFFQLRDSLDTHGWTSITENVSRKRILASLPRFITSCWARRFRPRYIGICAATGAGTARASIAA